MWLFIMVVKGSIVLLLEKCSHQLENSVLWHKLNDNSSCFIYHMHHFHCFSEMEDIIYNIIS